MRVIENPPILYTLVSEPALDEVGYTSYKCRECGSINNGKVFYVETEYGHANLMDLENMELDDFECDDHDNFEITSYQCWNCGNEGSSADSIFIACDNNGNVYPSEE